MESSIDEFSFKNWVKTLDSEASSRKKNKSNSNLETKKCRKMKIILFSGYSPC